MGHNRSLFVPGMPEVSICVKTKLMPMQTGNNTVLEQN